jgi:hypothetical protein
MARGGGRLRALLKLAVAVTIVASTYFAILRIAEHKADALAGGGTFALDRRHGEEMATFASVVDELQRWGEPELAASLAGLQESGHLWVAPHLAGERSAIYVNALGLVSRIYVRRDELASRRLPFPDLDVPEPARRAFASINLAGTLFHELQHHEGLEDEGATYEREITWYRGLGERAPRALQGEERRWFEWARASALESARAAREEAVGKASPREP